MAISYVSGASAAATSLTMPSHQSGDLLLMHAYRDGSTTQPTVPSGWLQVVVAAANTCAGGVWYKWAASGSETSGTWTNATGLTCQVYRGATGAGGTANTGSSNSISYPALTLFRTDSTSWVARFAGHRSATNITTNTPSGYTARAGTATECRGCDTNGTVSSNPTSGTQSVNASSGWVAFTVELMGYVGAKSDTLSDDFNTGSVPESAKWNTVTSNATISLSSGKLVTASSGAGYGATVSKTPVDAAGSSVWCQVTSAQPGAGPEHYPAGWSSDYGGLSAFWKITSAGVTTVDNLGESAVLFSHTAGTWYRIRESGGTLYYDTSTNGSAWTNQNSRSGIGHIGMGCSDINAGYLISSATGQTLEIDNLNVTPNSGAFFAMF